MQYRIILFPFDEDSTDVCVVRETKMKLCFIPVRGREVTLSVDREDARRREERWDRKHPEYTVKILFKNSAGMADGTALSDVGEGDIIISGHCEAGKDSLASTDAEKPWTKTVDSDGIAKILNDAGLRTAFQGKFKVFACMSAEKDELDQEALAARMARRLLRDYPSATLFGYHGAVKLGTSQRYKDQKQEFNKNGYPVRRQIS